MIENECIVPRRWRDLSAMAERNLCFSGRHLFGAACTSAWIVFLSLVGLSDDSTSKVREGIKLYAAEQYEEASKSFAAATESLEKSKSERAAVAAFDEACALHRKGDLELARDRYLKAGLSRDKVIATSAHFNLGVIASDAARQLAGESPETVPADKRKEVLSELNKAIDSYRHCLELDPKSLPPRRNLETLRQWMKYYTDRWREADLQKRREETNLVAFLEFLVQAQLGLKETTSQFKTSTAPNSFAEMKRLQSELRDEIPYLKEKIDSELRPKESDTGAGTAPSKNPNADQDLERGIALLSGWADEASSKMSAAEGMLAKRDGTAAAATQKLAASSLDQIWDAVVPFHPLLAKELAEQTQIAKQLTPDAASHASKDEASKEEASQQEAASANEDRNGAVEEPVNQPQTQLVSDKDWTELMERQETALRKTRLLAPKAESELAQFESQPKQEEAMANDEASNDPASDGQGATGAPPKIDPEAIKAGYQKAIELAPKAVQEMESSVMQLAKPDREQAAIHAEEARRILQEIQDAQPKTPQEKKEKEDQKNEEKDKEKQDSKDQQEKQEDKDKDQSKEKDQEKEKDQGKEKEKEKDQSEDKDKSEEKKSGEEDKKTKDKKDEQRQEPKVSSDRIEDALRRVREREQVKRERDRELKARVMGRVPVDKDW